MRRIIALFEGIFFDNDKNSTKQHTKRKKLHILRFLIMICIVMLILVTSKFLQPSNIPSLNKPVPLWTMALPAPTLGLGSLTIPKEDQNPNKSNPQTDPYMIIADTVVKPGGNAHIDLQFHANNNITFDKPIVLTVNNLSHVATAPALIERSLPNTNHLSLKTGETYNAQTTITVPKTPGYYQIEMKAEIKSLNGDAKSTINTKPIFLFVQYNPSTLAIGRINVNKQVMVNKHQLTVKKITMGPDATEVSINLTHPLMAAGLHVELLDQNGQMLQTLKTVSNLGGNGNDTFRFAPVPKAIKSLSFVVTSIDDLLPSGNGKPEGGGPWKIDIPLS